MNRIAQRRRTAAKATLLSENRLAVYSACLPDLSPDQAIDALVGSSFRGIEWRVGRRSPTADVDPPHYRTNNRCTIAPNVQAADEIAEKCDRAGIEIVGLSPYVAVGDVQGARNAIDMAAIARAPFVRFRGALTDGTSYRDLLDATAAFYREIIPHALASKVRILIEMHHGTICSSASLTERLVSRFDPEEIGVIYDVGNLPLEGYEDYATGLELLSGYVAHVHLKNVRFERRGDRRLWEPIWSPIDDGLVDIPRFARALNDSGYRGWIAIEDFSTERPTREMLEYDAAYLGNLSLVQAPQEEADACYR